MHYEQYISNENTLSDEIGNPLASPDKVTFEGASGKTPIRPLYTYRGDTTCVATWHRAGGRIST
jgi:hypothetical protein